MKRFAKLLVVTLSFGVLGFVMSLVPQKNATGAAGAPVNIVSPLPLPVTGSVNANLTNVSVPISGSVSVGNPRDASGYPIPLLARDADNPARTPVQDIVCGVQSTSGVGFARCLGYTVPAGQELVMEDLTGRCDTPKGNVIELFVVPTVNNSSPVREVLLNPVPFSVALDSSRDQPNRAHVRGPINAARHAIFHI